MDALTIVIMLILFIIAMIFVFSTALLTPYIGKRNLVSVVLLGLIVGLVGGAFLLSPIVDDIPDFTRTIVEESTDGSDIIEMDLSTNGNITQIIENISSITGVQNVSYDGINIKIDEEFDSDTEKTTLVNALTSSNTNITGIEEKENNTFFVKIAPGGDPQSVLNSIYSVFSTHTYTHLRYTSMQANATVAANNVTKIMSTISNNGAVVLNVTGPTEDKINSINKFIPDKTNVVLFAGVIGVIVGLAGFFIDTIFTFTKDRKRNSRKESSRDRIKRKTVPGTDKRKRSNKNVPRRDSIDIFDESFEGSKKQTIGSNKQFKPMNEVEEPKSKIKPEKSEKKSKSRFGRLLSRSSNKTKKPKQKQENKKTRDNVKSSENRREVPKVRPRRKD
ncbi:hypothetical protein [Methanosphaera sp. WGK6]|uniref:hypothetical protein n=1 Tax=Methanosphaera sp. WGK6 TaxID=1561964 RepID=UPI00084C325C|nr:hypothetical protein [Methanosphaera sp. WGK6]OED30141.1 hypothetical protein NL43_04355 [Methanosphaera sp. WGK6]